MYRERLGHVALRADAERHQQRAKLLAAVLLQAKRPLKTAGIKLAAIDQDFAESLSYRFIHAREICTKFKQ